MKKWISILLIFSMILGSISFVFAEDVFLLSNELVGAMQPKGNNQCTAYSGAYLIRRRAAIEYSKEVALQDSLSMNNVINSLWVSGGLANSASVYFTDNFGKQQKYTLTGYDLYNAKEIGSHSTRLSIIDMADSDPNIKLITNRSYISHGGGETDSKKVKELLIYLLSIHPEGIVIWVYRNSEKQHAVLLTNYDANADNFYCVDPAYRTVTGGYSLKGWVTDSWLGHSQGTVGSKNLDTILKYIISIWMVPDPMKTCVSNHYSGSGNYKTELVNGTYQAVCKDCGQVFPIIENTSGNDNVKDGVGRYRIDADGVQFSSCPYQEGYLTDTSGFCPVPGYIVDVVATTVNAYGNTWYKTSFGSWFCANYYNSKGVKVETALTKIGSLPKPSKPCSFMAEYAGNNSVSLSWDPVSNAKSYKLQYFYDVTQEWRDEENYSNNTQTSALSTGWRSTRQSFTFRVCSVNDYGQSDWVEITCTKSAPAVVEDPVLEKPEFSIYNGIDSGKMITINTDESLVYRFLTGDDLEWHSAKNSTSNYSFSVDETNTIECYAKNNELESEHITIEVNVPECSVPVINSQALDDTYLVSVSYDDGQRIYCEYNNLCFEYTEPFIIDEDAHLVVYANAPGFASASAEADFDVFGIFDYSWSAYYTSSEILNMQAEGVLASDIRLYPASGYKYVREKKIERDSEADGYFPEVKYGDFGDWSEWDEEKQENAYDGDILIHEVKSSENGTIPAHTVYRYGRWSWENENTFCPAVGQKANPEATAWIKEYTDWLDEPYQKAPNGKGNYAIFYHDYNYYPGYVHEHIGSFEGDQDNWYENGYNWFCYSVDGSTDQDKRYFWEETLEIPETAKYLYSYRDRQETTVYVKWNRVGNEFWTLEQQQNLECAEDERYSEYNEVRYRFNLDSAKVLNKQYFEDTNVDNDPAFTRASFCQKLIELKIITYDPEIMKNISFADISADSDLYEAFCAAKYYRILEGDEEGNMHPSGRLSRGELAASLYRMNPSAHSEYSSVRPGDVDLNTWYYQFVMNALDFDLMKTDNSNLFHPTEHSKMSDIDWVELVNMLGKKDEYLTGVLKIDNSSVGTVRIGDTFDVDLIISNNPGIIGMEYSLNYDPTKIELVTVAGIDSFGRFSYNSDLAVRPYVMVWDNAYSVDDIFSTGTAAKLKFRTLEDAAEGSCEIYLNAINAFNNDLDSFCCLSANVTVDLVSFYYGDIEFVLDDESTVVTSGNAVTITESKLEYGYKWSEIVTITSGMKAKVNGVIMSEGQFEITEASAYPDAGSQSFNVVFTGTVNGVQYTNAPVCVVTKTIRPRSLQDSMIQTIANQTYSGSAIEPSIELKDTVKGESKALTSDVDYESSISYENNTVVGTANVTVRGKGNYTGSAIGTFNINQKNLSSTATVEDIANQTYSGIAIEPVLTVKDGENPLTLNTDYTVAYTNNTAVGKAKATITFSGNYTGTTEKAFTIVAKDLSSVATVEDIANQTYSGIAIEPALTVKDGEKTLTINTDYTVAYTNNTVVGTATATITFSGNYSGTTEKAFTIVAKDLSLVATVANIPNQTYSGTAIQPVLTVKDGETTLTLNTDYTVAYTSNTVVGTAKATVTFTGNYTGTTEKTFTIEQATVKVTEVQVLVAKKKYDATTSASALVNDASIVTATGIYSGDSDVKVVVSEAAFVDAKVGTAKPINVVLKLDGDTNGNYKLESDKFTVCAEIEINNISVEEDKAFTPAAIETAAALQTLAEDVVNAVVEGISSGTGIQAKLGASLNADVFHDAVEVNAIISNMTDTLSGSGLVATDVALTVEPVVKVKVTEIKATQEAATTTVESFKFDVTVAYKVYAVKEETKVEVGEGTLTDATKPIEIIIPIPTVFDAKGQAKAWIKQIHKGKAFYYEGTISDNKLTFENVKGFSEFEVFTDFDPVAMITRGAYVFYDSLQNAVDDVNVDETIEITAAGVATVSREITFMVKDENSIGFTLSAGSNYTMKETSVDEKTTRYAFTYNGGGGYSGGGGGGSTKKEEKLDLSKVVLPFVDVVAGSYYETPVKWAYAKGITDGIDDTHFGPTVGCTRAQVVTFLWKAAGKPEPKSLNNTFEDVVAGSWYEKAVLWAIENKVTDGVDATHFAPDTQCSRAEIVGFLWKYAGKKTSTVQNVFADVDKKSWYESAVLWAIENKVTDGVDSTHFAPGLVCDRAQIVTFLFKDFGEE